MTRYFLVQEARVGTLVALDDEKSFSPGHEPRAPTFMRYDLPSRLFKYYIE